MNGQRTKTVESICQSFKPLVKKYARIYQSGVPDAEAEAWLVLVQAVHEYDSGRGVPLAGYLNSRVKYGLLTLWRQNQKRQQHEFSIDNGLLYNLPAGNNPQTEVEQIQRLESLEAAVGQLPPRQRLIIVYNVMDRYKLSYMADVLGISAAAVHRLKARALARLKTSLREWV
ncbi:rna polymerase sigma factor 70 region 4 type 2 [Lucifera butyrica]|uniref:Rna polymerase sigma factor 70 region 4 type 2 n=1 Tax=Lucifera butyrica TaxID=1351585 RepID=A0A498REC1_9FIRM|nr:sigma-70 family RNA polymerase sigma factor [Lucifera butyrica]VBB08423.1 rna polymerase sigma factor 70 region 4 type 2 [Lucifera butyrica]